MKASSHQNILEHNKADGLADSGRMSTPLILPSLSHTPTKVTPPVKKARLVTTTDYPDDITQVL